MLVGVDSVSESSRANRCYVDDEQDPGDDTSVKIADFGFAKKVTHENSLKTVCGTAQYVAPEILDNTIKGYNQRCDIWSLGCFAYVLLGGYPPFEGILGDLAEEIKQGYFEFHDEYWDGISDAAKEMISSMLVVKPERRVTAGEALSCRWMEMEDETLIVKDLTRTQDSIRKTLDPKGKVKAVVKAVCILQQWKAANNETSQTHNLVFIIADYCQEQIHVYCWNGGVKSF